MGLVEKGTSEIGLEMEEELEGCGARTFAPCDGLVIVEAPAPTSLLSFVPPSEIGARDLRVWRRGAASDLCARLDDDDDEA